MPRRYNTRDAKDAVAGDIFWLSPRPTAGGGSQINKGIRDIFDHPVLVLSIHTAEHFACVLILSSLNGKNINEYSSIASTRASHLPIYPAPAHPDSGRVLFLDNGLRLDKDTNVKLKTRYLLPLSLINFRYCDHRTQQKYTLQSVSLDIVLGAVDSSQPAKYPPGIRDSPSLIGGPKKSIPSPSKSIPLPAKPIPPPSDSMTPTYTTRRPLAESSYNVRPLIHGTYHPKVTNCSRADLPQEQSFQTPLLADVLQQHKRCHYNTDLERDGASQSTSSTPTVEGTRSLLPFILVFLAFFICMAYWKASAKA